MRLKYAFFAGALACGLCVTPSMMAQDDKPIKEDVKDAGKATGHAAKKTGKKIKHGTKKGVNKAAGATERGAEKIKDKTSDKQ